jgi:hypothetical protein
MPVAPEIVIEDKFAIDDLLKRGWQFKNSEDFTKFLNFIANFDHYSRYNTMLVYVQNRNVTFFGGPSYWKKKFHRTVKKDARPYLILTPNGPVMLVYDIFDTNGVETADEFLAKGLGHKPLEVKGHLSEDVLLHAIKEANNWGIKVSFKPLSYFNGGSITTVYTNGDTEISLKEGLMNEEYFRILMHELAHLFLGHTGHKGLYYKNSTKPIALPIRELSTTAEELEAETVSYLICRKLGLEARSAEYIADYIKDENDLLQFSHETVIKIADKIERLFVI